MEEITAEYCWYRIVRAQWTVLYRLLLQIILEYVMLSTAHELIYSNLNSFAVTIHPHSEVMPSK